VRRSTGKGYIFIGGHSEPLQSRMMQCILSVCLFVFLSVCLVLLAVTLMSINEALGLVQFVIAAWS